jgi:hypothetical protein
MIEFNIRIDFFRDSRTAPRATSAARCRVGRDVDQMWTRSETSAAGSKTATL